jgi:threonine/homoserine/homoserine lactone efflux protein
MEFHELKNAFLIGFFMSFMIGPVFFVLIKTSILKGARAAIVFDLGVILGDIVFMLIAYYGSRNLLERIKDDPRLFIVGGLVLIIYGLISYLDKNNKKDSDENQEVKIPVNNNYIRLFFSGFFLNFINIGVLLFWLGMIVVIGPTLDMNPNKILYYFGAVLIGYFLTDLGKIILAKQLKNKMTPIVIYRIKKTMGIILMFFGVVLMLKGFGVLPKNDKLNTLFEQVDTL